MSMKVIEHIEVTNPAGEASITFSLIPQTYTDLYLVASLRKDQPAGDAYAAINLNGSSSGFNFRALYGSGSGSGNTFTGNPSTYFGEANYTAATSGVFASLSAYFSNYTSSNYKTYSVDSVTENNATTAYQNINAGIWSNNAPISSITLTGLGNFIQYSAATLYGITAGSDGTTTVS